MAGTYVVWVRFASLELGIRVTCAMIVMHSKFKFKRWFMLIMTASGANWVSYLTQHLNRSRVLTYDFAESMIISTILCRFVEIHIFFRWSYRR